MTKTLTKRELATQAHANHEAILSMRQRLGSAFLDLGRLLYENREREYWKALGHETFEEYLASPEVCIRRSQAFKLLGVYETFRLRLRDSVPKDVLATIGIEKLELIRGPVNMLVADVVNGTKREKTGQTFLEWIDRAKRLARNDLKAEVRRITGKDPETEETARRRQDEVLAEQLRVAFVRGTVTGLAYDRFSGLDIQVSGPNGPARLKVWSPYGLRQEFTNVQRLDMTEKEGAS